MTTFDEEMMKRALREAADDFAISDTAMESILDEARDSGASDESPRIRAFIQRNGRTRSTLMAVAACVVALAVAVPLFNSEGGASKNRTLTNAQGVVTPNSAKTVAHGVSGETITELVLPLARMLRQLCRQRRRD